MSTVKKTQKRPAPELTQEEDTDKENIPIPLESQDTNRQSPETHKMVSHKRRTTESYHSIIVDLDRDEEGSMTRRDSEYIQQLLSSQTQSRKSSASATNPISDIDETESFMTGRRDTADMRLLQGIQELIDKSTFFPVCFYSFYSCLTDVIKMTES